jgi:para-nitrobenzyl esterase
VDGVIEVKSGRVQGVRRTGVWSYSGIPYAASTAGRLRWRPPQPPAPWAGVRRSDRFGPVAPQSSTAFELALGGESDERSEDCLTLNIWTPGPDGARRPVMVWIHGGSFVSGSGSLGLYRGGTLAREGDVVVVTINYRLGLLGFLAHPALAEEGQTWLDGREWQGFGNWGLADQVAALHWVQEHVASFGGDPQNVTVFGESAGGMSISALLAVPEARGLFHRAIVQSGPPYSMPADQAASRTEKLAGHLGVSTTRASLERVPAEALVAAATEVGGGLDGGGHSGLLMMPAVDRGLLPVAPETAVASGAASDVDLLIGTNRDETSFFTLGNPRFASLDEAGLREWVTVLVRDPAAAGSVTARVREARLARGEGAAPRDLWTAISSEILFRGPTVKFADAHAGSSSDGTGTYCYLFTWESPAFGGVLGSCHALEIPFVFGTVHHPGVQQFSGAGEEVFALSASMRRAWLEFARSGSPTPPWSMWDPVRRPTMVFGPWPGGDGLRREVDVPRDEELRAVAGLAGPVG